MYVGQIHGGGGVGAVIIHVVTLPQPFILLFDLPAAQRDKQNGYFYSFFIRSLRIKKLNLREVRGLI